MNWLSKLKITRLDRYIIGKFLGTYFFAIALIIAIIVIFDYNENIDKFATSNVTFKAIVFDYYLNLVPYLANTFSALFVFISVIYFTSKLAETSEIIAMFAAGVSFKRLLRPYLISAGIIAIMTYILSAYVIP
ncbi:MAG: LptF/LptG family permease, partial [Bacteroidaceae bacterium]|nr:LptF/LptG family permease [Bacteroidaceae bacterium]